MNIIEPCCAERQLGQLLRESRGHAVLFQTNGDMTLQKWITATMLMAGDRPRTLTLAVPIFTAKMMTAVAKYLQLGWVERLRLLTTDPLPPEMAQMLAKKAGCEVSVLAGRVELAADGAVTEELLMFTGPDGTVAVQGAMPDVITPGLHLYAGIYGRTGGQAVRSITDAWEARFRARRYTLSLADSADNADVEQAHASGNDIAAKETDGSPIATVPAESPAGDKKKKTTRKTKKQ